MTKIFFLLLLTLEIPFSSAQADVAGRIRLEDMSYFKSQSPPVQQNEVSSTLELETKNNISENWRFRFEPKVRVTTADHTASVPVDGDFRDTQVEGKTGSLHVQVGSFIKNWEGTDGLNPMDIVTMKNLRDPLNSENLGSWGIAISGGEGLFTWDLIYVPWQTESRLPGEKSAWLPRSTNLPLEKDNTIILLPKQPEYALMDRQNKGGALANNYGGRAQLHGESWDFSLGLFEGAAQIPALDPNVNLDATLNGGSYIKDGKTYLQATSPIGIGAVDYRRRTVALGLVYSHESWIFRVAGRHDETTDDSIKEDLKHILPTWSEQSVAGVEKTITIGEQNVIFSLQGAYGNRPDSSGAASAADLFQRAILYGVRWPWSDTLLISYAGFVDTRTQASLNHLSFQKKITDPSTVEFSVDRINGPDDTLLGIWADQSRASLAYIYQF